MTPADVRGRTDAALAAMVRNLPDATLLRIARGMTKRPHPSRRSAAEWATSQRGPWRPGAYAAAAGVSRQTATGWLGDLVASGSVVRLGHGLYAAAGAQ